jgi:hypothetical protein
VPLSSTRSLWFAPRSSETCTDSSRRRLCFLARDLLADSRFDASLRLFLSSLPRLALLLLSAGTELMVVVPPPLQLYRPTMSSELKPYISSGGSLCSRREQLVKSKLVGRHARAPTAPTQLCCILKVCNVGDWRSREDEVHLDGPLSRTNMMQRKL